MINKDQITLLLYCCDNIKLHHSEGDVSFAFQSGERIKTEQNEMSS